MEPPTPRVRVVLGDVSRAPIHPARARAELEEQSPVGAALARGLVRAQLSVAVRLSAVVALGLGGLPLLFAAVPAVAHARLFGVSLPWLLLGVLAFPFLYLVGAVYVHLAERNEQEFLALVEDRGQHPAP
ncbi:hypothetical protein [Dactylosporangium sp. CA-233914]|uniref:hypothetical protein n=1 Tax=Dactylosporangium sp. CA-233914 TaxID=3239934 RepID=UPI003D8F22E7